MRAFKTKYFDKWALKQEITNGQLIECLSQINSGNVDADLGSGLIKQRIALSGKGKSGGARVILAVKIKDKAFFLYGFKKSDQGNLTNDEKKAYKIIAKKLLAYSDKEIKKHLDNLVLIEIEKPNAGEVK